MSKHFDEMLVESLTEQLVPIFRAEMEKIMIPMVQGSLTGVNSKLNDLMSRVETMSVPCELLSQDQVMHMTSYSKSTLRRRVADGLFPKPIIEMGTKRWLASEVRQYLENLKDLNRMEVIA